MSLNPFFEDELTLMIPGPTEVSGEVLKKLSLPMKPHYGPEWSEFYWDVLAKVKKVFQTEGDLHIFSATSSAGMEVAVTHAAEPGETILICNNGFFGDRFTEMALQNGLNVETLEIEYGKPVTGSEVKAALEKNPSIRALALVHNESSTAAESKLDGICKVAAEHDVISVVDCVSSMGAIDIPVDKLGIDICVSGTQKGFGAPAGLAFVSVSEKAWDRIRSRKKAVSSWYLNLETMASYREKWKGNHPQGPNTSPVSLYLALNQALDEILTEGLKARFERHTRARDAVRAALKSMGLKMFVADDAASRTLTAFSLPEGINGTELRKKIQRKHRILLAGGIGATADTVIRIGHLALTATPEYLLPALKALATELREMGVDISCETALREFEEVFSK